MPLSKLSGALLGNSFRWHASQNSGEESSGERLARAGAPDASAATEFLPADG